MGIKYVCDVCEGEYIIKGPFGANVGPAAVPSLPPSRWAIITCVAPKTKQDPPGQGYVPLTGEPKGFLVCSQACAEKALVEAKEHLRKAFAELHSET